MPLRFESLHPVWRRYRLWWLILQLAALVCVGLAVRLRGVRDLPLGDPRSWGPLAAMLTLGFAALQILTFRCPSCGRQFHSRWRGLFAVPNPFSRACVNCGFPRWGVPETRERPRRR